MDSDGRLTYLKRQQGSMLVLIALAIVVLIAMTGLVVDLGYMFSVKAKLQNAADAGALAGAGRLNPQLNFADYTGARNGAKQFADINFNLTLDTNVTTNDPGGDIVLGFWHYTSFHPSGNPVNAVKVVTRRAGETGTGIGANSKVDLFLGKVLGINTMGAKSSAIAYRPPRARTFFMIGRQVCSSTTFPVTLSPGPGYNNLAWTSLLTPSTNANEVQNYFFCPAEKIAFDEVCGKDIYTSGGVISSVFKSVELDMYDLGYDAGEKTFAGSGSSRRVTSWKVIVPVAAENDPTVQPVPHNVWGYAEILITRACGSGGGNACPSRGHITAPGGVCSGGEDIIEISSITCTDCAHSTNLLGALPVLAK